MNGKQTGILIIAFTVAGLIVWHDLPIEFPMIIYKVIMLFVKLFAVLTVAAVALVLAARNKESS